MRRRAKRGRMGLDVGAGQRCSPNDSLNPEQRGPDTYQVNVCSGTSSSTRNGLRAVGGVAVALGVALISIGSVAAASARASVQTFRFRWLRRRPASRAPCTGTSMPTAPGAAANRERLASPSRHRARWRGLGTGDDRRRVLDHHRHTRRCRAASRGQRTPELATPGRCPTTAGGGNRTLRSRPGDRRTKVVSGDVVPTYVSQRGFGLAVLTGRSTRPLWPAARPVLAGTAIGELLRVQNRDETRYWHCRCHIPGLAAPGWDHVAMASSPSAAT